MMNFYRAVFPEKNFLVNIHKKRHVLGYLPFNIYPFWSELRLKKTLFTI